MLLFLISLDNCTIIAQCRNDAHVQGFSQAKLAWKKKNAIPTTNKEAKAQRPDGRGDGGARGGRAAPNRGGGRAPVGESEDKSLLHQPKVFFISQKSSSSAKNGSFALAGNSAVQT
jgi:hypothetical protein